MHVRKSTCIDLWGVGKFSRNYCIAAVKNESLQLSLAEDITIDRSALVLLLKTWLSLPAVGVHCYCKPGWISLCEWKHWFYSQSVALFWMLCNLFHIKIIQQYTKSKYKRHLKPVSEQGVSILH